MDQQKAQIKRPPKSNNSHIYLLGFRIYSKILSDSLLKTPLYIHKEVFY